MDAVHQGADAAQVGFPSALGNVVGVTDSVTEVGRFSAKIALTSHKNTSRGGRVGKAPLNILTETGRFAHPCPAQNCP